LATAGLNSFPPEIGMYVLRCEERNKVYERKKYLASKQKIFCVKFFMLSLKAVLFQTDFTYKFLGEDNCLE
jgi:hypothetical protein